MNTYKHSKLRAKMAASIPKILALACEFFACACIFLIAYLALILGAMLGF